MLIPTTFAELHEFDWELSYIQVNPDTKQTCRVISINEQFPAPIIRIQRGDTIKINLQNGLEEDTAIHFHGIFQHGSNQMDGPTMLTQCPIPPGSSYTYEFTVNQTGTYWYHAHEKVQYGDGLRGVLIVEDPDQQEGKYDEDVVITLSDWYYKNAEELLKESKGHEPSIDSSLFNDTVDVKWAVKPDTKYLIRLVNIGMSASQYFYVEDHDLVIVEIDGVAVEPVKVDSVMLATGQRYSVLLKTKNSTEKNYGMVSVTNMMMRKVYLDNWLVYNTDKPLTPPKHIKPKELKYIDDMNLKPLDKIQKLPEPDHQFTLNYTSGIYTDEKLLYYTVNGSPHLAPKIPTLMTVLSSTSDTITNPVIYGESTNSVILQSGETVEIIVNSMDHMRHPFHLHGHNFQVLARGRHEHYNHSIELPDHPMIRDTVVVPSRGFVVLRFKADNPGVWFFHCHTDWHAATGLGVVFIESPELIKDQQKLSKDSLRVCKEKGISTVGNAAGNKDFLNMEGDPTIQQKPDHSQPTASTTPSAPTTTPNKNTPVSFHTKVKVVGVYLTIMLLIAIAIAVYMSRHIGSKRDAQRRRRSSIANYEPVEQ